MSTKTASKDPVLVPGKCNSFGTESGKGITDVFFNTVLIFEVPPTPPEPPPQFESNFLTIARYTRLLNSHFVSWQLVAKMYWDVQNGLIIHMVRVSSSMIIFSSIIRTQKSTK